jgi:hypothetical protein
MKTVKILSSALIAGVMLAGTALPANAAESTDPTGTTVTEEDFPVYVDNSSTDIVITDTYTNVQPGGIQSGGGATVQSSGPINYIGSVGRPGTTSQYLAVTMRLLPGYGGDVTFTAYDGSKVVAKSVKHAAGELQFTIQAPVIKGSTVTKINIKAAASPKYSAGSITQTGFKIKY